MTMANGSVLVVGGEAGSNGAPVPSIEILPTPSGGPTWMHMDWLASTDPNNLYPFLFVLPSGGIFVVYYNQVSSQSPTLVMYLILPRLEFSTRTPSIRSRCYLTFPVAL
jgi:hypothetical protein